MTGDHMAFAEVAVDAGIQHIIVQTTWQERELIKTVPGTVWNRPRAGVWNLPLSWSSCLVLRGVFGANLHLGDGIIAWARDYNTNHIEPSLVLRSLTAPTDGKDTTPLYSFQEIGARFLTHNREALLGDDMGTGKTIQALSALRRQDDALPALVICPNSVKTHWQREINIWYPESTPYVITGGPVVKRKLLAQAKNDPTAFVIINIEAVRMHSRLAGYGSIRLVKCRECDPRTGDVDLKSTRCDVHQKELNAILFKTVIIDEAHRIKDPHSKQTRACWAVMHQSSVIRRWAMTGTPIANAPDDLWSIMHGIAPNDYPTRGKFIDRYCLTGWNAYGGLNVIGIQPDKRTEFFKILDPHFRAMPKALVLPQLPPRIRVVRYVEMVPKQRKAYAELSTMAQTQLDDGELLSTPSRLVRRGRLMQLASSYCTIERPVDISTDDWSGWHVTPCEPSPKIDELLICMDELGPKPIVIAAEHRQLIELAAARLSAENIPYGLITGAVNQRDRDRNLAAFQAGDLRVLLFTVKAGGTGLTMTAADTIIFIQRPDSMIDYVQAENRVHRIGSEHHESILVVHIVTNGTVENRQMDMLYEKMNRLEEIMRARATIIAAGGSTQQLDAEEQLILSTDLSEYA
jgi:SWI/SNF-related matrix-associated actin-dependent regulator 1 of chromatin subfamily A